MLGAAPMATHSHGTSSGSSTDTLQPCVTFAPTLIWGPLAACTISLTETHDRWHADANTGGGVGRTFAGMIAGKQWRAERYNVYVMPNGSLCMGGHDPLTLLNVAPRLRLRPIRVVVGEEWVWVSDGARGGP